MAEQTMESGSYSIDNPHFNLLEVFEDPIQPSSPTEEILSTPISAYHNTFESTCDITLIDFDMINYSDQLFKDILNSIKSIGENTATSVQDDFNQYLGDDIGIFHSTESNDMANPVQSSDERLAMNKSNHSTLPVNRPHIEKLPITSHLHQTILLSESVAVTVPKPNQLQLVYPLEDTYRARYKSDYFPQTGRVRRPRYVADNINNHHVTLQMPTGYNRDLTREYVRVSLITTLIDGHGHFYSPYKFQTNHDDIKIPDQNPIYLPVKTQRGKNALILHLVLIKSKSDQLNHAQPLKPFSDTISMMENNDSEDKLAPKDLITKYQLDKAHIAFTLCTKLPDGSFDVHPETTIISSVITESTGHKTSKPSNNNPKSGNKNSEKKISCPNCKYCFALSDVDAKKKVTKRKSTNRTSRTVSKSTSINRANKKKKIA